MEDTLTTLYLIAMLFVLFSLIYFMQVGPKIDYGFFTPSKIETVTVLVAPDLAFKTILDWVLSSKYDFGDFDGKNRRLVFVEIAQFMKQPFFFLIEVQPSSEGSLISIGIRSVDFVWHRGVEGRLRAMQHTIRAVLDRA